MTVDDVERAMAFYRDVLGVPFLFDYPGLAFFDLGGVRLMLSTPEGEERLSPVLYFRVPDIEQSYGSLRDKGVEFVGEPHVVHRTDDYELSIAFFNDGEGNALALMHESGTI